MSRFCLLTAATLAVGLGACEQGGSPTGVDLARQAALPAQAVHLLRGKVPRVANGETSVWVESRGGLVNVGSHVLVVPPGAVRRPTLFTMQVLDEGYVEVVLHAYERRGGTLVRVGTARDPFLVPVVLKLDYTLVGERFRQDNLVVVYLPENRPDGRLEPQPSIVDVKNRNVSASLTHFSRYAVGSGRARGGE